MPSYPEDTPMNSPLFNDFFLKYDHLKSKSTIINDMKFDTAIEYKQFLKTLKFCLYFPEYIYELKSDKEGEWRIKLSSMTYHQDNIILGDTVELLDKNNAKLFNKSTVGSTAFVRELLSSVHVSLYIKNRKFDYGIFKPEDIEFLCEKQGVQ